MSPLSGHSLHLRCKAALVDCSVGRCGVWGGGSFSFLFARHPEEGWYLEAGCWCLVPITSKQHKYSESLRSSFNNAARPLAAQRVATPHSQGKEFPLISHSTWIPDQLNNFQGVDNGSKPGRGQSSQALFSTQHRLKVKSQSFNHTTGKQLEFKFAIY